MGIVKIQKNLASALSSAQSTTIMIIPAIEIICPTPKSETKQVETTMKPVVDLPTPDSSNLPAPDSANLPAPDSVDLPAPDSADEIPPIPSHLETTKAILASPSTLMSVVRRIVHYESNLANLALKIKQQIASIVARED